MIIYHGSKFIVDTPLYGYGRKENDYGLGFYCTEDIELAREWACQDPAGGFVNRYELPMDGLRIFEFDSNDIMAWLAILLSNRIVRYNSPIERNISKYITENFIPDVSQYDVIKGYRADDSYFTIVRSFLSNTITLEQLGNAMKLGKLGFQICLKSRKSFDLIRYIGTEPVDGNIYNSKWLQRDYSARKGFYSMLESSTTNGVYARDILDKEMTASELRLR